MLSELATININKSGSLTLRIKLAIASVVLAASIGVACNIPVFRYALERWKPDACEVLVFHDGSLTAEQTATVERWESHAADGEGNANAKIIRANVATAADDEALWSELTETSHAALPHVLVRTKLGHGRTVNHWHGSLDEAAQIGVFDSPARDEIRRRLLEGHAIVWLLVASSDEKRTDDARNATQKSFESLAETIKLPEGIGLPGSELYADVPLVLKFSLLEIDPNDPEEKFLTSLLTGFRRQAHQDGEPLLVPVFGRGRALEVIPASDMSAHLMEDLTLFLSGACSCQVKERNPGFDLLINADWDGELFGDDENRPPDRSAEEGNNRQPVLLDIPRGRK